MNLLSDWILRYEKTGFATVLLIFLLIKTYISLLIWLIQLLFYSLKFIENIFDLFNIKFVHVILIKKEPNFIFYYLYHVANCAYNKQILNIMVLFIFDWQTVVCVKKSINVFKAIWMSCLISIFVLFLYDRRGYELSEMLSRPKVISSCNTHLSDQCY